MAEGQAGCTNSGLRNAVKQTDQASPVKLHWDPHHLLLASIFSKPKQIKNDYLEMNNTVQGWLKPSKIDKYLWRV